MSSFTAYIFKADADTLLANARRGASGSLFGLWTSTGNPVVRVIMGKEEAKTEGQRLYEAYRLCNIGEWRIVDRNDRDGRYRIAHTVFSERQSRRTAIGKILIIDVDNLTGINPYLYTPVLSQPPIQRYDLKVQFGIVELLDGENPFSRARRGLMNPSQFSPMVHAPPAYQQPAVVSWSQDARRYAPSTRTQEIDIASHQWYSNEKEGNANMQFVIKELKQIAEGYKLDISRDITTHDLTVMFTDNRYRRSWTVKFPSRFPEDGATISYKTWSSSGNEYQNLGEPKEPSCRDVREAMRRIVRHITEKGPIR
ncbi:PREDICTED: uncharacterized protein LOC107331431 isoform X2 [Acropora digitifera]|uniref:uncharacterized protein LOC107331431 isoform X2 n=1 Tax=Acropora digitifera TaxID=70779 RepID=UPI00077A68A6|nr:PREDICTED: uncharacterized protein LOC107331431 isoform X2 [Acropora digitifera]